MNDMTPAAQFMQTLPSQVLTNTHSQPSSMTHTTTLSACHFKIEDFANKVRKFVENFFSNDTYPYNEVHALLLSWKEDDLGVADEVEELENVLRIDYACQSVRRWEIPSLKPYSNLEDELYQFKKAHSSSDSLLIVYYAGHGYLDHSRLWKWAAYPYVSNFSTLS